MFTVLRGITPQNLATVQSTEYRVQSTEIKRNFANLQWFQKFRTRYLFACFVMMFIGVLSSSNVYSQVLDEDCGFIVPVNPVGITIEDFEYMSEEYFPNWVIQPFTINGKRKYGSAIGNKMEIILDYGSGSFINNYTVGNPYFSGYNGVDNSSMREFAKEQYLKESCENFLKESIICSETNSYFVFSFITKRDCFKERKCKIKLGPYACCSNDTNNLSANLPEGYEISNENGFNYLFITRKFPCNERSCCEERIHYLCNPNATQPNNTWVVSHRDKVPYAGTECAPNVITNPNCPINTPSTCKSGCGSN